MPAILFGSISTVIDTSELQRRSFNDAFADHGLNWEWGVQEYRDLLTSNGGSARIADYADRRGDEVDAGAVHASKSAHFQDALTQQAPAPRPGVAETIAAARGAGWKVGLVTTTSADNLTALFAALEPAVTRADFDVVVDSGDVAATKPDPEAYSHALQVLDEQAGTCVAIEDNVGGLSSARAAGVRCVAFPNANTATHDFGDATRLQELDFAELSTMGATR